jgi:hypothetical protein
LSCWQVAIIFNELINEYLSEVFMLYNWCLTFLFVVIYVVKFFRRIMCLLLLNVKSHPFCLEMLLFVWVTCRWPRISSCWLLSWVAISHCVLGLLWYVTGWGSLHCFIFVTCLYELCWWTIWNGLFIKLFMTLRPIVPSTCLTFKNFSAAIYFEVDDSICFK